MSNKQFIVYAHKNKHNNKQYIGITSQEPDKRWGKNGRAYLAKNNKGEYIHKIFACALLKYPDWNEDWEHILLEENLSKEEAKKKEKFYIAKYHTFIYDEQCHGYNMTPGGDGNVWMYGTDEQKQKASKAISEKAKIRLSNPKNHPMYSKHLSEETKQKISQKNTGKQSYWKGKTLPEETKQKMSQTHKQLHLKHSEETKKKISDSMKKYYEEHPEILEKTIHRGKANGFSKGVRCLETGQEFDTVKDAMMWCGLKGTSDIGNQIKGKTKSAGKHPITKIKLHWEWINEGGFNNGNKRK